MCHSVVVISGPDILSLKNLLRQLSVIKFPFKRKACQVYEGGCCRQASTVVSLVVWWTGGCYCKVVAVDRKVQWCL